MLSVVCVAMFVNNSPMSNSMAPDWADAPLLSTLCRVKPGFAQGSALKTGSPEATRQASPQRKPTETAAPPPLVHEGCSLVRTIVPANAVSGCAHAPCERALVRNLRTKSSCPTRRSARTLSPTPRVPKTADAAFTIVSWATSGGLLEHASPTIVFFIDELIEEAAPRRAQHEATPSPITNRGRGTVEATSP